MISNEANAGKKQKRGSDAGRASRTNSKQSKRKKGGKKKRRGAVFGEKYVKVGAEREYD
jgi:hypothetical protein